MIIFSTFKCFLTTDITFNFEKFRGYAKHLIHDIKFTLEWNNSHNFCLDDHWLEIIQHNTIIFTHVFSHIRHCMRIVSKLMKVFIYFRVLELCKGKKTLIIISTYYHKLANFSIFFTRWCLYLWCLCSV